MSKREEWGAAPLVPVAPIEQGPQRGKEFNQELLKARQRARDSCWTEPIIIGRYEDFAAGDLRNPEAKIGLENGNILLLECPLRAHEAMVSRTVFQILQQLNNHLITGNLYDFMNTGASTLKTFVNLFECTRSHGKQPDGCIVYSDPSYNSRYRYGPVVVEVALGNQSYPILLKEGVNWLSSYTNVEYAVLLKFEVDQASQELVGVRIIVLRRLLPKFSDANAGRMQGCLAPSSISSLKQFLELNENLIREHFSVEVIYNMFVDREYLNSGNRIQFILDSDSLQLPGQPSAFRQRFIEIDLTETVRRMLLHVFPEGIKYFE